MRYRVTTPHERSFDLAPRIGADEVVCFIRDDRKNPGWFLGRTRSGIEGYFPAAWFSIVRERAEATARRDYDAAELTVDAGEIVELVDAVAGWLLVQTHDGRIGWIPEANAEASS